MLRATACALGWECVRGGLRSRSWEGGLASPGSRDLALLFYTLHECG